MSNNTALAFDIQEAPSTLSYEFETDTDDLSYEISNSDTAHLAPSTPTAFEASDEESRKITTRYQAVNQSRPEDKILVDHLKQVFSGVVMDVNHESQEFVAELTDDTNKMRSLEQAVFSLDELDQKDANDLAKGDSFFWYIGSFEGPYVSRQNFSKIKIRKFRHWSDQELNTAIEEAKELANLFNSTDNT